MPYVMFNDNYNIFSLELGNYAFVCSNKAHFSRARTILTIMSMNSFSEPKIDST